MHNIKIGKALEDRGATTSIHRNLETNVHQMTTRMQGPIVSIPAARHCELEEYHHKDAYKRHTFLLITLLT